VSCHENSPLVPERSMSLGDQWGGRDAVWSTGLGGEQVPKAPSTGIQSFHRDLHGTRDWLATDQPSLTRCGQNGPSLPSAARHGRSSYRFDSSSGLVGQPAQRFVGLAATVREAQCFAHVPSLLEEAAGIANITKRRCDVAQVAQRDSTRRIALGAAGLTFRFRRLPVGIHCPSLSRFEQFFPRRRRRRR